MTFLTSITKNLKTTGDVNAANITVSGNVDGVNVSDFHADYNSKINQDVKTNSNPQFNTLVVNTALSTKDITVTGDLTVNGTTTQVNSTVVTVNDPIMKLANGNVNDTFDIGYYGEFNTGGVVGYSGVVRDASDGGVFKFFTTNAEPGTTVAEVGMTLAGVSCGDLNVGGDVVVTGTVDGRNISDDGKNQDEHIADTSVHFEIDDSAESGASNVVFSADKIITELGTKSDVSHVHAANVITYDSAGTGFSGSPGTVKAGLDETDIRITALENSNASTGYVVTEVDATTHTVTSDDYIITVKHTVTAPVTITLPQISTLTDTAGKKMYIIKDIGGSAGSNNITISAQGPDTIDGSSTFILSGDYNAVQIVSSGSNWYVM